MKSYRRMKKSARRSIISGVASSAFIFAALSLASAFVLMKSGDPSRFIGISAIISLTLAGVISSAVNSKRHGAGCAVIAALLSVTILIIASMILNRGAVSPKALGSSGCYLLASVISSLIFKPKRR